jgi:hypothetical protein
MPRILGPVLVIVLVAAVALPAATPRTSLAVQPCFSDPGRGSSVVNYHAGATRFVGSQVGGVYSQIEKYNVPRIVHTLRGSVVDYVMVKLSTFQYGQFGWAYSLSGNSIEVFSEVNNNGTAHTRFNTASGTGAYAYFTVLYDYVPGRFTFQLDGGQWLPEGTSGGYNPTAGFVPNAGEISGEIVWANDQLPGDRTDAAGHFDAHIFSSSWQNFNGSMFSQHADLRTDPSSGAPYGGTQFYIWDHKCPN